MSEKSKRVVHTLTFVQKIKVADWLRANAERLKERRPMYVELAKDIGEMFDLTITDRMLADMCNDLGVTWELRGTGGKAKWHAQQRSIEELTQRLDSQASQLQQFEVQLESLNGKIERLLLDLGVSQQRNGVIKA